MLCGLPGMKSKATVAGFSTLTFCLRSLLSGYPVSPSTCLGLWCPLLPCCCLLIRWLPPHSLPPIPLCSLCCSAGDGGGEGALEELTALEKAISGALIEKTLERGEVQVRGAPEGWIVAACFRLCLSACACGHSLLCMFCRILLARKEVLLNSWLVEPEPAVFAVSILLPENTLLSTSPAPASPPCPALPYSQVANAELRFEAANARAVAGKKGAARQERGAKPEDLLRMHEVGVMCC